MILPNSVFLPLYVLCVQYEDHAIHWIILFAMYTLNGENSKMQNVNIESCSELQLQLQLHKRARDSYSPDSTGDCATFDKQAHILQAIASLYKEITLHELRNEHI